MKKLRAPPVQQLPLLAQIASLTLLALLFAGCSGSGMTMMTTPPPVPQSASFAFAANMNANTVSAFAIDPKTGALSPVAGSPFAAGTAPEFMATDPSGSLLFVANSGSSNVSAFQINTQTGALAAVPGSPFAVGARPEGVAVAPMGKFVFVANQASNSISVFTLAANGALAPIAGSPFAAAHPFSLAVHPSGKFLYTNNFPDSTASDLNSVSTFQIAVSGALSPLAGSPSATANAPGFASSIGLAMDAQGKFLFVTDHMAQAVVPFKVDPASGTLTPASTLPTPPASCNSVSCHNNPLRAAVHPNSQLVYASNVQAGTVSAFGVVAGGLSPIAEFPVGQHPFGVALDPTGTFLYVANRVDNSISAFSVNASTGMLTPVPGSPFPAGAAPTNILIVAGH
jgi:DNA-binding beta-propeller fold protein YncE